ncbi:MAG: PDDEXK nuclease domain-containing protein [Rickettsia endosymbiont of Pseudomimeciton antennatum]|nr:PDDEXK nuclease domain-containing protein [Rickettsia endosymbiont of Pseudomimeciton antennatum]
MDQNIISTEYKEFLEQLKTRVATSRYQAARSVNKELIILYHHIGSEILTRQEQHAWGAKIIDKLSRDLISAFPEMKGFSTRNLKYMRQFAKEYPDLTFVQQVAAQLPWFHLVILIDKVKDKQARIFYIYKVLEHGWSRNILVHHIETMLYQREGKAITNFSDKLPSPQSDLVHQTLKDPYLFDFLSISDTALKKEIENTLIKHIEKFLLELGSGFAFVGRQYKLSIGNEDYYVDLLFYHLQLRSFIIIELKAGKFSPRDVGQLNFYLSAIDDQLKHSTDNPSIGLILCKDKGEQIKAEYALRDMTKPIGLAEYKLTESLPENIKTALPTIEELEAELFKDFSDEEGDKNKDTTP